MMQFLGKCSRNWIGVFAIIFAVVVFSVPAMAQVVPWYHVYDSTYGHDRDTVLPLTASKMLSLPATGKHRIPAEYANSYAVKYNHLGNFVCEMAVSGPVGTNAASDAFYGVAVDSQDNIIIAGTISGDFSAPSYYKCHVPEQI